MLLVSKARAAGWLSFRRKPEPIDGSATNHRQGWIDNLLWTPAFAGVTDSGAERRCIDRGAFA